MVRVGMVSTEQLGERYLAVHHRMHRAVDDEMCRSGLSLARTKVLIRLGRGPTRQSVLAAGLGVAPHTITDIVDALERDGLAQRLADPTDRRAKLVAMTAAGHAALAVASATRERLLKRKYSVRPLRSWACERGFGWRGRLLSVPGGGCAGRSGGGGGGRWP